LNYLFRRNYYEGIPSVKANHLRLIAVLTLLTAAPAAAQQQPITIPRTSPLAGGVPSGIATPDPITLTIVDAVTRSLQHNLGVLMAEQDTNAAGAERTMALSRLLPNVNGSVTEARRKTNLEAFGFPLGPGFPRVVGPYNVFDARVSLSQAIFDANASNEASAAAHRVEAAKHSYREMRSMVILASANTYLQALASQARSAAAEAQLASSQAIHQQAIDLRSNGIIAGLDVVRAEVRVSLDRQRATAAANDAQITKLNLARLIGLPIGQEFTLVDRIPEVPDETITLQQALDAAYANREDYQAAIERQKAAESMRKAALGEMLPSVHVNADFGAIGLTVGSSLPTFNLMGTLDVPIFNGGRTRGRIAQATADLQRRTNEVEDLKARVYYDVRSAFLDLEASRQQFEAASRGTELASQQLQQSRDRFAAGVANNIEVVQAQEAVAVATEQAISARYGFSVAKALLAQSIGNAEQALLKAVQGSKP
jgi:outer membrane protein TolC